MKNKFIFLLFIIRSICLAMDPLADTISSLSLENYAGSDLSIVNAARISYKGHSDSLEEKDICLLENMIVNEHKTPFEQTFLQFRVKAPIFVTRQWMRHRIGVSYNEVSARYSKMDQEFYIPKSIEAIPEQKEKYKKIIESCSLTYQQLLDSGIKREEARCVLPVSLYTTFYFGCNLNSLFHFAQLRYDKHAQWEIQQYARCILLLARDKFPYSINFWCKNRNITL
jgi:thymidylate synthase (FAD)